MDIIAQAATARAAQEAALAAQRRAAADAQPVVADPAARQAGVQEAPAGGVVGRESAAKVRKLGGDFDHLAPYPPKPPVSPERLAKYASWVPKAPAPADVRDAKCPNFAAKIKEGAKTTPLPTTSVIFCFCNENKGALYHSMHSVIERTPPELLHEIILVDDGGNSVETGKQLEDYVATLPVTVHIVSAVPLAHLLSLLPHGVLCPTNGGTAMPDSCGVATPPHTPADPRTHPQAPSGVRSLTLAHPLSVGTGSPRRPEGPDGGACRGRSQGDG